MNFGEIQAEVEKWLRDRPLDTVSTIPTLINDALIDLQREHNYRCMEATASFVTVPGTNVLGTVARFKERRGKPWYVEYDGSIKPFQWADSQFVLNEAFDSTVMGPPRRSIVASEDENRLVSLECYPLSDSLSTYPDGEYRITLPYWQYLATLSDDGDSNWFTNNAPKFLWLHALGWATLLNIDDQRGATYLQLAETERMKIKKADKLARVAPPRTLTITENANELFPEWSSW